MKQLTRPLIPTLIGADLNCYHLARAFHEAYGVKSYAFGRYETSATLSSRIVTFTVVPEITRDEVFLETMEHFAEAHPKSDCDRIILGCTDDYANLIVRNRARLEALGFLVPYSPLALMDEYLSKERFYQNCDIHGILYPKTKILHTASDVREEAFREEALGFSYPIIVKPSNSVTYWKHPFDGMNKVYVADTPDGAMEIANRIFESGYDDSIILQDMIPGNDSEMYVLTAYCGADKKVKMMCLGHVMLEEHTPRGRGNHAAIITEYRPELTERFQKFLEDIGYVGFANFDIKHDTRDDTYRAFEINLRQGRSNYYVTAAGANLAELLVGDYITHSLPEEPVYVKNEILWHSIPKSIVWTYTHNEELTNRAKRLVSEGKSYSSLWYRYDTHLRARRSFYVAAAMYRHYEKYKTYCRDYQ